MSDIDNLEYLAGQLRRGATQFSNAAQTLQQQAQRLDWSAQDLTGGVNAWAGTGSDNFKTAWQNYHSSTQKSATALDNTSQALTKLAQKIDDAVQQMRAAQASQSALAIGLGVLTVGLAVLDVLQLGLDPATDAATVAVGSADAAAVTGAEAAAGTAEGVANGLLGADAEIAGELDDIVNSINDVSDVGDISIDSGVTLRDINFDEGGPSTSGDGGSLGDGGGMPGDTNLGDENLVTGGSGNGAFPPEQRLPYEPEGTLTPQIHDGSCVAACGRMILSDNGMAVPEAYVRDAMGVDTFEGGFISNAPGAFEQFGLETSYAYQENLTIDSLEAATENGPVIASVRMSVGGGLHAIVVDSIENGEVFIRDPLGESYGVTIENFLKLWTGKAVIPLP